MKKGKFTVLEGGEGSGKGTQIEMLKREYSADDLVFIREPGGTAISEKIRELILGEGGKGMDAKTELLLFYASRAQLMKEIVIPALDAGRNVICDRFSLSTIAYQVYGRERTGYLPLCEMLDREVVGEYAPDLTVFLDIPPERGLARVMEKRGNKIDRLDAEPLAFHERVRAGYLRALKNIPHVIINADRTAEEVSKDILSVMRKVL